MKHSPWVEAPSSRLSRACNTGKDREILRRLLKYADSVLLMDVEPQRPGEDEMAPARRLLARALANFPRAFNLVVGDALYLHPDFCRLALDHHKDFLAVLKNENRDLLGDVRSLIPQVQPVAQHEGRTDSVWWDIEGFTTGQSSSRPSSTAGSSPASTPVPPDAATRRPPTTRPPPAKAKSLGHGPRTASAPSPSPPQAQRPPRRRPRLHPKPQIEAAPPLRSAYLTESQAFAGPIAESLSPADSS